jgi:acetyl/propionyl-CoA carboxylase alpha subunit/acetyl-CoA carboxylase carboxyltransferase component
VEAASAAAERVGFPLMVKAAAGGGGRGIRRVDEPGELAEAFERARDEAARSFGDATVFLERLVTGARHVEVQVIADAHGTVWAPGVRDCSVQRRNQKVIEESSSTALRPDQEQRLREAAVRLAREAGYVNAGTVEFLYQPDEDLLAFLEVNTRLQVEHPVTEVTTGIDLVRLQLEVAMGRPLPAPEPPPASGHAIEARLNAEDAQRGFAPAAGRIRTLVLPTGPGIRVDTGIAEGDEIAPEYDSMVAKVIAWGADRDHARVRLRRALSQMTVLVDGGTTNKAFLLDLLDRPEVVEGRADTGWLDRLTASDGHRDRRFAEVGLLAAAIEVHEERRLLDRARFLSTAARGRPESDAAAGHDVDLRWEGGEHRVHVATGDLSGWYRATLDGVVVDVVVDRLDEVHRRLTIGGRSFRVVCHAQRTEHLVEVEGVQHRFSRDDGGLLRAPAVSLVVSVDVAPGDQVRAGQRVAVVEAMKMETAVLAPGDGVVEEVFVAANTQVDVGAPLLRVIPARAPGEVGAAGAVLALDGGALAGLAGTTAGRLEVLRSLLLGFDVADIDDRMVEALGAGGPSDPDEVRGELGLLRTFADLCGLTRGRREADRDQGLEARSPLEHFHAYLRSLDADHEDLPQRFRDRLHDAIAHYGLDSLERTPQLEAAVHSIHRAVLRRDHQLPVVRALLERRLARCAEAPTDELRDVLDRLIAATQAQYPEIGTLARSVRYRCIDDPLVDHARAGVLAEVRRSIEALAADPDDAGALVDLVASPVPVSAVVAEVDGFGRGGPASVALLEALTRRLYGIRDLHAVERHHGPAPAFTARYRHRGRDVAVGALACDLDDLSSALEALPVVRPAGGDAVVDLHLRLPAPVGADDVAASVGDVLGSAPTLDADRVAVLAASPGDPARVVHHLVWRRTDGSWHEDAVLRGMHPMVGERLHLWRLENFDVTRVPGPQDIHVFDCVARDQSGDERLVAVAEVRDITPVRDADDRLVALPELERVLVACLDGIRAALADEASRRRLEWNRVMLFVWPTVEIRPDEVTTVAKRLVPLTTGLGIEQVLVQGRVRDPDTREEAEVVFRLGFRPGTGLTVQVTEPPTEPMRPLDDLTQKVLACRRRGTVHPHEVIPLLTTEAEHGEGHFTELDLDPHAPDDRLVPVERPPAQHRAGVVVGLVTAATEKHPEGMTRVAILGDPTKAMGSIAEPECRRILAALDLAEERQLPVEWFALSAGARIAMDSGSENLDWVATVLRRIVRFTQGAPGRPNREINVVVAGVNVGAQPYWNAEATMLMHTRGILVMTPDSTMVLTGKQAIDFSGGVSAEDNIGIGGHDRVMGPNGQAQYWAPDMVGAVDVLFAHYDHAYVQPGEPGPRPSLTTDPVDRDITSAPHAGEGTTFRTVGEIFSDEANPGRKKPFDIRSVLRAVVDHDLEPLERWADMADAQGAVVLDAHLGGLPICAIGIESRPLPRTGTLPADGPSQWSAGTLFPLSSKKVARAVNAASGVRPVVVLANLSGFDGSPESLRRLQLEYGAEIGRAIVNFDGPIVLCVLSRYHGGAFVVFSSRLNDHMQVLAVEGAHASVIGGAPAAAVVFARDVDARTDADPRIRALERELTTAPAAEQAHRRAELATLRTAVRHEKLGEVASEFDAVHSVERARAVGSVDDIIPAHRLRPALHDAVLRGLARWRP